MQAGNQGCKQEIEGGIKKGSGRKEHTAFSFLILFY
jgi:hypothetical protein